MNPKLLGLAAVVAAATAGGLALAVASSGSVPPETFGSVGRWITYPDGRVFIPHGFNSVVTSAPYYNIRLSATDAAFLADEGFTVLRLAVIPQALEPTLGMIEKDYAQRFVSQTTLFGRYGISTLVALNQDRYAETCSGDGFPDWAVLASCDEVTALSGVAAWGPFWTNTAVSDGTGLIDHYLDWWRALGERFAPSQSLLGYDLLNEPKVTDDATLGGLWKQTIAAVRTVDRDHVAFVEPRDDANPSFATTTFPSGTGFTGHVYCATTLGQELTGGTPTAAQIDDCIASDAAVLQRQVAYATSFGQALLVGEFGATDELREQTALVDAMGQAFVPWTVYSYNGARDSSGALPQGILRDESMHGSQANAKQAKLDVLTVPYPMATAGTPKSWSFDRKLRTVSFSYLTRRVGGGTFAGTPQTVVFVPRRVYPHGYTATATGGTIVSRATAPWLRIVAKPGVESVRLTIAPRKGSTTRTPLQVNQCGYDLGACG